MKPTNWLRNEIQKIKFCHKCSKGQVIFLFLMVAGLFFCTFSHCKDDFIKEPESICNEGRPVWVCGKCGYQNYVGIDRCSVCGTKRKYR